MEFCNFLQGSHLDNFPLKTLKLGWVVFHSLQRFSFECRKTKTKVLTLVNHKEPVADPDLGLRGGHS